MFESSTRIKKFRFYRLRIGGFSLLKKKFIKDKKSKHVKQKNIMQKEKQGPKIITVKQFYLRRRIIKWIFSILLLLLFIGILIAVILICGRLVNVT